MSGPKAQESTLDLTQVDGVKVIARQTATRAATGLDTNAVERPITAIDQILLEDGRTLFQCVRVPRGCGHTWERMESVFAHLRTHSDGAELKRANAVLAEANAKKAAEFARRSAGAKNRKPKSPESVIDAPMKATMQAETESKTRATKLLTELKRDLGLMAEDVDELLEIFGELPSTNPALVEKAEKWDAFKKMMGTPLS